MTPDPTTPAGDIQKQIAQIEHDLAVAKGEGWTDKLVWMATKDIPYLLSYIRHLETVLRELRKISNDSILNKPPNLSEYGKGYVDGRNEAMNKMDRIMEKIVFSLLAVSS